MKMTAVKIDLREWVCECGNIFFVDCDADEYPTNCPYCMSTAIKKKFFAFNPQATVNRYEAAE